MRILLLGGYFRSGKTTILVRLAEAMLKQEKRVCIIGNEGGTPAADDLLRKRGNVEISTIQGGCVCCQATGSLIEALNRIAKEIAPDWVLIELTGIAFQDSVRYAIADYVHGDHSVIAATVVDAFRWKKLLKAVEPVVTRQIQGADIVVVNKIDQNPDFSAIVQQIAAISDSSILLPMQATEATGETLLEVLDQQRQKKEIRH
jgi:G3E family GTPase